MIVDLLQTNLALLLSCTALFGLIIGSFLNVVIHRLPIMMERDWRAQCEEFLNDNETTENTAFNLLAPGSRCPKCEHSITALENIPLASYLWLKGRCSECGTPISPRYPIIELVTAILSVTVVWHFGFTIQAAAALALTWALITLSMIDFDQQLLPDSITLPFLWLGLILSLFGVFVDSHTSIIGALAGYLSLWAIFHLFRLLTGKEGMGYGDFKLLALFGAWLGWQLLPVVILLSSLVGAVVGISLIVLRGHDRNIPIPFGPYLAAAGWIAMLWGQDLTQAYLAWAT
ncbi:prepilin peptidase [Solemya pervernicosa gill symbiont]|uniref:Prepilin leader peptidase/N-methyltransferase n=2 Tax=Gammaproteobacteria incertae sedis TaxID=118884 RepID=A0A1T2L9Q9_9GAMM|nr:A24 family peptidase [Candidatus Reidiella endopervernicosa]OOZ41835.1 prepilin peptidase [Solemya pervernicosa gill symbiont]QKQ26215.1 prepilin peptidase [Candidatus Reidiella endopervernicosa]